MFGSEEIRKALEAVDELKKLNANLEQLHVDIGRVSEMHADVRVLVSNIRNLGDKFKMLPALCKHLSILNQIFMQVSKKAGTIGTVQAVIDGFAMFAKQAR